MHFVALVQDITERKQAEEKIKEQNRRLEILLKFSEQSIGQINMTSLLISLARSTLDILLAAEAVSVFLFDEHLGRLIFRGWASHGEGQVDSATVLYHTRLAELIYQSGNLQIVGDMSRQPMLVYWWQLQGSMLGLPLPVDGKSLGVLIATNTSKRYAFDDENSQWLQTLAVHAITAIQNVRLFEQVIAERERARQLGQQVIDAQEGERGRISRELHDEAGQSLTVLKINLHLIAADLPADFQHIRRQITDFEALIDKTMQHIRELIMNLRPLELDLTGLDAVLQNYCEHFANLTRIPIDYRGTTAILLGDTAKTYLYRFLQEALTNVLKHAQASRVWVRLSDEANKVSLSIEDDGRGFNPNLETGAEDKTPHFGLSMMQERLSLLGGRLELVSSPGQGTHLVAHLPGKETV